jgi:hypothetical protein
VTHSGSLGREHAGFLGDALQRQVAEPRAHPGDEVDELPGHARGEDLGHFEADGRVVVVVQAGHRRRGIANPLGAIWSASMMLDHLGHPEAGAEIVDAFSSVLATTDARTPDLGGHATTKEFTELVLDHVADLGRTPSAQGTR